MRVLSIFFRSLTLTALGASLYIYYYTAFCGWKWKDSETRILFLADPQIEGDAKIEREGIRGNDIYIRHVYTSFVSPYSLFTHKPTHTIILGDLFSSQWTNDKEFKKRVERYKWIFGDPRGEYTHELINLTGNHDIGYGSDMSRYRVDRWEREFGKTNFGGWIPSSSLSTSEDSAKIMRHRIAVINSMNIDGPASDEDLRLETWSFLDSLAEEREQNEYDIPLILLSHIPIYKEEGLCIDGPMTIFDHNDCIKEQNHLSKNASKFILTKLKPKFIFAGHDHEGCDITHVVRIHDDDNHSLEAYRTSDFEMRKDELIGQDDSENILVVREVTVRSVMGGFEGNAGLFEIKSTITEDGNKV
ncbi:13647_t:CDS:2 [Dentiscutata erythropus]|uniref:13647_t:CDS:1 n=1 Tax=Dentiscutata erythropus TaxID=1348616 RepID=A0A9N8VW67_9GLOM|nr:13647_t:CDS:2 [Dentiscutata erythropus]